MVLRVHNTRDFSHLTEDNVFNLHKGKLEGTKEPDNIVDAAIDDAGDEEMYINHEDAAGQSVENDKDINEDDEEACMLTDSEIKEKSKDRKHTPIVSDAQRRLFAADAYGKKDILPGLSKQEAKEHLEEVKGKKLPEKVGKKK